MTVMVREDVIRAIIARELNRLSLTEDAVKEKLPELYESACTLFGTWETALRYAGIRRRKSQKSPPGSREETLQHIRELCWKGYKPTMLRVERDYPELYLSARKYFACWEDALLAAGIHLSNSGLRPGKPRQFTPTQILKELCDWHATGHSLRWRAICLENRVLAIAAKRTFGSWRKVLQAAGIMRDQMPSSKGE